jgi:hypothetical protein
MSQQKSEAQQGPSHAAVIEAVCGRYRAKNWTVFAPKNGPNDIVAHFQGPKGATKYHFVQLAPGRDIGGFIQNAFSNGAMPIFAHIKFAKATSSEPTEGATPTPAYKISVTFSDANTKNRVIV